MFYMQFLLGPISKSMMPHEIVQQSTLTMYYKPNALNFMSEIKPWFFNAVNLQNLAMLNYVEQICTAVLFWLSSHFPFYVIN